MEPTQDTETIHLPTMAIWTSTSAQAIRCRSGHVWLTDADAVDHILQPGDERAVSGLVVIEALEPVELLVSFRRHQMSGRDSFRWDAIDVLGGVFGLPMTSWRYLSSTTPSSARGATTSSG